MNINNFLDYLKENIRKDDLSHLNDNLPANKKNEARWPDDDDDYDYADDSTKDYGDFDDWYDDDDDNNKYGRKSSNPKFDDDDDDDEYDIYEDEQDDDIEHLTYLLRQMFRNAGVSDVRVTARKNDEILIEVYMGKKETLRNVIKVFEVANKLKRDILAQYDSEFEMWQSKDNRGILTFGFTLDEGLDDDNMPF
jgi:hypothetical protein